MIKSTTIRGAIALFLGLATFSHTGYSQCMVTTGPTNDCSYGDAIDNLTIGATVASNPGCSSGSGYSSYATPVFNLDLGTPYSLVAAVGGATYNQGLAIWIDLNNNGQYESAEQVYASTTAALNHSGTINIATGTTGVALPMRVMCVYNQTIPAANACTSFQNSYGETEDYTVILSSPAITDDVELTSILSPIDNACGNPSDSLYVRVTNNGTNTATNIAVEAVLSGMISTTLTSSIISVAPGATQDINLGAINTEQGGTLDIQAYVAMTGDLDNNNDTLNASLTLLNSTDLVISGDTLVCPGENAELTVNTNGSETYIWTVNAVPMTGDTINFAVIVPQEVIVNSSNSCRAADTIMVATVPMPTASFTSTVNGGQVDFTGTATEYTSISWDFGDGNNGSGLTPSNNFAANGAYWVCMSAIGDCDTVTFCDSVFVTTLSVGNLEWGQVHVFPNPTVDQVSVSITDFIGNKGAWVLYDMNGRVIESDQLQLVGGSASVTLSFGEMEQGSYIFTVLNEKEEKYSITLVRQ